MDGSLIADTANAIASFANVGATVTLGVLVYKFTKQDEAGRIERALQNDRDLRREDWARERKARLANPAVDTLAEIPANLLTVASFINKPVPFSTQRELVGALGDATGELTRSVMVIPDNSLRMECGKLAEVLT